MIAKKKLTTLPYEIKQLHFAVNCQVATSQEGWPNYLVHRFPKMDITEYLVLSKYYSLKSSLFISFNSFALKPTDVFTIVNKYTNDYTATIIANLNKGVSNLLSILHDSPNQKMVAELKECVDDLLLATNHAVAFLNAVLEGKAVNWVTFEIQNRSRRCPCHCQGHCLWPYCL